jgi:succinate dehydrogenase / fumarate reductase flavoprotein subunit
LPHGEANFSDHGANRLGASALMQGLADGYFVIPTTLANYLGSTKLEKVDTNHDAFKAARAEVEADISRLIGIKGNKTADELHRKLGKLMWDNCGMQRSEQSLKKLLEEIPKLRDEFWSDLRIPGEAATLNQELEKAGRVADFIELGELMARDALERRESCGGHFRSEYQTADNEAQRDDENFCHVAVWEHQGQGKAAKRHTEALNFENVKLATRSYK